MTDTPETRTRRHPNWAICPHCDYPNVAPLECLREQYEQVECGVCELPFEERVVATGDARNGDFVIETRPIEKHRPKGYALEDEATPPGGNVFRIKGNPEGFVIVDPWAGPIDDLTPPGGDIPQATILSFGQIAERIEARKEQMGRSDRGPAIGQDEKLSDSHNCYLRRFEIEGDRLMLLGAASQAGSGAINKYWQDLGRDLGFVWTTVRDFELSEGPGGKYGADWREVATFTAEVEDVIPASPAFEAWWKENRLTLPGARHEIAREAFEAGSRNAATTLARLDGGVIEIVREIETERPRDAFVLVGRIVLAAMVGGLTGAALTAVSFLGWSAL